MRIYFAFPGRHEGDRATVAGWCSFGRYAMRVSTVNCVSVNCYILTRPATLSGHVQWISDALFRADALTPTWLTVSIRIFATRGGTPLGEISSVDSERTPDKEGPPDWVLPPSVRLEDGRPDLKSILRGEVSTATGSMSVTGAYFFFCFA